MVTLICKTLPISSVIAPMPTRMKISQWQRCIVRRGEAVGTWSDAWKRSEVLRIIGTFRQDMCFLCFSVWWILKQIKLTIQRSRGRIRQWKPWPINDSSGWRNGFSGMSAAQRRLRRSAAPSRNTGLMSQAISTRFQPGSDVPRTPRKWSHTASPRCIRNGRILDTDFAVRPARS